MSYGLEFPAGFIIGSNRRRSSVMETHFSIHHCSVITEIWEGVGYEVSWSQYGSCHLCIWIYEVLNVRIKNFVKELLHKRTLVIVKAIPWIPEPAFLRLSVLILVKSCWVLLYLGFVEPCCRWGSWADLFWIVLHDGCSLWWRWEVNVWPLEGQFHCVFCTIL